MKIRVSQKQTMDEYKKKRKKVVAQVKAMQESLTYDPILEYTDFEV